MTCRAALRTPFEGKPEGRELPIADMKTLLEKSKQQVARSQTLIDEIGQRLQSQASA